MMAAGKDEAPHSELAAGLQQVENGDVIGRQGRGKGDVRRHCGGQVDYPYGAAHGGIGDGRIGQVTDYGLLAVA
ncbi:hypothetical protein D3C76_1414560 [compost metagenome]